MKRLLVLLAILLFSQVGYGQQKMDQLFNAFRGESDVTSVYISKKKFQMMPVIETAGLNLANLKGKIETLKIHTHQKSY